MDQEELEKLRIGAAQRAHDDQTQFGQVANKAAIDIGTEAVKAVLLLNGGSCVAMLAFVGTLASKDRMPIDLALPILFFAVGACLAVLTTFAGYLTNLAISHSSNTMSREYVEPFVRDTEKSERSRWWGEFFRYWAIGFAISGIVAFGLGVGTSYLAFKQSVAENRSPR